MFNNKTSGYICTRSSCLPGVSVIANKCDTATSVVVRATKHKRKDMFDDECKVLEECQRTFQPKSKQKFQRFPPIWKSLPCQLIG